MKHDANHEIRRASLLLVFSACSHSLAAQIQPKPDRQVAITIDDLPAGAATS